MKDNQLLWTIPSRYGEIKVLVERGLPLVAGDKCMFYNAITVVDEIQNPNDPIELQSASITTDSYISEEDAAFMRKPELADTWGKLKHGFAVASMPKLLGSTHPDVGVALIDEDGKFITVRQRFLALCQKQAEWDRLDKPTEETEFYKVCHDDLDFIELIMNCEKEFNIKLDDTKKDEYAFDTVKDFIDWASINVTEL